MAVEPRLLNPTVVEIEQTDPTKTQYDNLRREPIKVIKRAPVFLIDAQVKWNSMQAHPQATQAGVDEKEHGYIIVRTLDLATTGKTLKRGDRIVKMGGLATSLYILRTEPTAHYGGEFKLLKVIFEDKAGKDA